MKINQNIAECIVKESDFPITTTTNVCTGETFVVEHGSADVALWVFLASLSACLVMLLLSLVIGTIRDVL